MISLIVSIDDDIKKLKSIKNVRFRDALKIAGRYFGEPRIAGSHHIFKMPWAGDPRINIQPDKNNKAKAYQVRILVRALVKLKELENEKKSGR